MRQFNTWATHLPVLCQTIHQLRPQTVLELGAGVYSTPMLAQILRGVRFVSAERTGSWQKHAATFMTDPLHTLIELSLGADYISDPRMESIWKQMNQPRLWDLIFVDHFPDEARAPMLKFIREWTVAKVVVVHDTSPEMEPRMKGLKEEMANWKYRYDYKCLLPWTTVLSQCIDVGCLDTGAPLR